MAKKANTSVVDGPPTSRRKRKEEERKAQEQQAQQIRGLFSYNGQQQPKGMVASVSSTRTWPHQRPITTTQGYGYQPYTEPMAAGEGVRSQQPPMTIGQSREFYFQQRGPMLAGQGYGHCFSKEGI